MASSGAKDASDRNDPLRAAGAAPSSATGMFSAAAAGSGSEVSEEDFFAQFRSGPPAAAVVLPEAPVQAAAAPVRPVAPPVREVFIKPGGRAAAVPVAAAPVAPKQRPGEVTSFLMAMGAVEEAGSAVKAEPVKVEAPVVEEVREVAAPAVEEAGAFTRMFQASDLAPVEAAGAALPVVEEQKPASTPPAGKPSFTELLKAITDQRPVVEAASPAVVAPVAAAEPVKVANINEILERLNRPRNPTPPAPPVPAPESVAGKLQAFRASVAAPAEVKPPEPVAAKAEPGAFTQFMAGVAPPAAASAPAAAASAPVVVETAPEAAGSFTQMMASMGSVPPPAPAGVLPPQAAVLPQAVAPPPPPPAARPGSMTQLLQSLDKPREGGASGSGAAAGPVNVPAAKDSSGFTEFFQSPLASPRREAERSPFEAPAVAPGVQGGGSFTQLMQALNQPSAGGAAKEVSLSGPPALAGPPEPLFAAASPSFPAPAAGMGGPGEFTKLMQTLDGPATAAAPPRPAAPASVGVPGGATSIFAAPAAAAPVAPSAAGPSEYTQVISGSALRDARAKAPAQAPAPIVPGAMQMPGFAMPGVPPPPPMPPMAAPPMPQMAMPGMQMPQMAPPAVPPPPAAAAKSTLQQYLPLIILANVLLVIVIVVILIFVLRAHK